MGLPRTFDVLAVPNLQCGECGSVLVSAPIDSIGKVGASHAWFCDSRWGCSRRGIWLYIPVTRIHAHPTVFPVEQGAAPSQEDSEKVNGSKDSTQEGDSQEAGTHPGQAQGDPPSP